MKSFSGGVAEAAALENVSTTRAPLAPQSLKSLTHSADQVEVVAESNLSMGRCLRLGRETKEGLSPTHPGAWKAAAPFSGRKRAG